jgi:hypothetical protein
LIGDVNTIFYGIEFESSPQKVIEMLVF